MTENIYQAPQSELVTEESKEAEFYIVSLKKFLILFIATFSLYAVYWFYKNWQCYKMSNQKKMWPIMRGIFSIFFTHSLFRLVDKKIEAVDKSYQWKPESVATIYVVCSVAGHIADRLSSKSIGEPYVSIIGLLAIVAIGWSLFQAQKAVNLACGDIDGASNARLTALNLLWIVLGFLVWVLAAVALYEVFIGFGPT